jgi:pseudoazurin
MRITAMAILLTAALLAAPVMAKTVVIQMKDKGKDGTMVFEPGFVRAEPGDTIRFVPTSPAHNAETIAGLLPTGAEPIKGRISQMVEFKATVAGLYAVKCLPHYFMGMVALVQVGKNPGNLAALRTATMPPLARTRMNAYLAQVR